MTRLSDPASWTATLLALVAAATSCAYTVRAGWATPHMPEAKSFMQTPHVPLDAVHAWLAAWIAMVFISYLVGHKDTGILRQSPAVLLALLFTLPAHEMATLWALRVLARHMIF